MSGALKKSLVQSGYQEARHAFNRRWSVIPVDGPTKEAKCSWRKYQQHQASDSQIRRWACHDTFAVVTGECSGVVVLDVDPGGDDALKGRQLPITVAASTPRGGIHYYFRHPGVRVKTSNHIFGPKSCVDIRGDGGYAILPDGDQRNWFPGLSPSETQVAEMPSWLLDLTATLYKKDKDNKILSMNFSMNISKNIHTRKIQTNDYRPVSLIPIKGEVLTEWYRSDLFICKAAALLNIPGHEIGETFCCVLPDHAETKPSASLYRQDSGHVLYRDWHEKSGIPWLTLAEVYAAQRYGLTRKLAAPEQATWQLRLLVECGLVKPASVQKFPLPDGLAQSTVNLYEGFRYLLGCKWLHTPDKPTVFAKAFACAWSDISTGLFRNSLDELIEIGAVVKVSTHDKYNLYLPGENK